MRAGIGQAERRRLELVVGARRLQARFVEPSFR
jgi:hypothetical protein